MPDMDEATGSRAAGRRRKDQGVESLRGVAIVLMVAGHVIGATSAYGLTVADDSGWRLFYEALEDIRMPLFSLLSGFVYAYRPILTWGGYRPMVRGKVRRLLVPFFVVGTVFFFVQMNTPGTNSDLDLGDLPSSYLFGLQHLWFLQAIFLIFLIVGCLDAAHVLRHFRGWAIATLAASLMFVIVKIPDDVAVFSANGAIRLLPFFLIGYGAHVHGRWLLQPRVLAGSAAMFIPIYIIRIWVIVADPAWSTVANRSVSFAVGALAVIILLGIRRFFANRLLIRLGGFSFGIYLLHVFGSAGARIVGSGLNIDNLLVLFLLGLAAGIGLPIIFELTVGRVGWISWGFLGQKPRRSAQKSSFSSS